MRMNLEKPQSPEKKTEYTKWEKHFINKTKEIFAQYYPESSSEEIDEFFKKASETQRGENVVNRAVMEFNDIMSNLDLDNSKAVVDLRVKLAKKLVEILKYELEYALPENRVKKSESVEEVKKPTPDQKSKGMIRREPEKKRIKTSSPLGRNVLKSFADRLSE